MELGLGLLSPRRATLLFLGQLPQGRHGRRRLLFALQRRGARGGWRARCGVRCRHRAAPRVWLDGEVGRSGGGGTVRCRAVATAEGDEEGGGDECALLGVAGCYFLDVVAEWE